MTRWGNRRPKSWSTAAGVPRGDVVSPGWVNWRVPEAAPADRKLGNVTTTLRAAALATATCGSAVARRSWPTGTTRSAAARWAE